MSCVFEQLLVKEAEGSETSEPEPEQNRPPDKAKERRSRQRLAFPVRKRRQANQ